MRVVIVGLGTQGEKRKKVLLKSKELVATVDKYNKKADYKNLKKLFQSKVFFDTVFISCPDEYKLKYINIFLNKKKNILVEKPLFINNEKIENLISQVKKKKIIFYIAYNHRFEPFFEKKKQLLYKKKIGNIYLVKLFYGNGTAKLVRNSWRHKNLSIIEDLASHLVDLCIFWFGDKIKFLSCQKLNLENKYPDYLILNLKIKKIFFSLEATYCSWKNSFYLETIGSKGFIKIKSLCKWKKPSLTLAKRIYPSGLPKISNFKINIKDPTWKKEIDFFRKGIKQKKVNIFLKLLKKEIHVNNILKKAILT
jgi:scyllo-inositol 2-dehydrogenase (NADP+)